jgi:hypothetical protein
VTQEAANVDNPPISEPINPALAERIAVSISNLTLNQLFRLFGRGRRC